MDDDDYRLLSMGIVTKYLLMKKKTIQIFSEEYIQYLHLHDDDHHHNFAALKWWWLLRLYKVVQRFRGEKRLKQRSCDTFGHFPRTFKILHPHQISHWVNSIVNSNSTWWLPRTHFDTFLVFPRSFKIVHHHPIPQSNLHGSVNRVIYGNSSQVLKNYTIWDSLHIYMLDIFTLVKSHCALRWKSQRLK